MTDQQTATTVPEPGDRARVVVDNGPTASTRLRLFWRDDDAAKGWGGQPGEHWFDDDNSDPMAWDQVCRNPEQVFPVSDRPLFMPCDAALLPLNNDPIVPCVAGPAGHEGLHRTERGVRWADPDEDEAWEHARTA
ncbi:hypothetical protein ACGFIW_01185 [Micromonospora sp. NPDC048935]|uniref:hypothetical protein n=1 Tax=Micromonospora sp. NPDC048935 TaxID=3364262 RepID=UPI00371F516E